MIKLLFSHYCNTTNIGDKVSCPKDYFNFSEFDNLLIDFRDFEKQYKKNSFLLKNTSIYAIIGGGLISKRIVHLFKDFREVFVWGSGIKNINNHDIYNPNSAISDEKNIVYGLRDDGYSSHFVPCVSCMSNLFDQKISIQHETVVYSHHSFPINRFKNIPIKYNNSVSFEEAVEFLASAENVITNSYHGAYWATLLGKKVFVTNWFNKKIMTLRFPPTFFIDDEPPIDSGKTYKNALHISRELNRNYYESVLEQIYEDFSLDK